MGLNMTALILFTTLVTINVIGFIASSVLWWQFDQQEKNWRKSCENDHLIR